MQAIVSNLRDMVPRETVEAHWVQVCLKHLGYYNSVIDGKYGEDTEQAVKVFQYAYGFEERDYVSLGVARAMIEAYYYAGGDLNKLPYWSGKSTTTSRLTPRPSTKSSWDLTFYGINKSAEDNYSTDQIFRVGDTIYFHDFINKDYIVMLLNSPEIRKLIVGLMSGMDRQQVNISQDKYKTLPIPLPPLAEQKRIVAKLEELLPLCERLK